jgi:hypothetical protein
VGDHVFMKLKANKSSLNLGNCSRLAAHFCGSFEILERIGPLEYMLTLSASMSIHNVFHVSLFKKYVLDANHVIDWNVIQVEKEGTSSGASDVHFGPKDQATPKSSLRASKGPMDLV